MNGILVNKIMRIIKNVMKENKVPLKYYSVGEYAELANCVEFENNRWVLYYGEKGEKTLIKQYSINEDKMLMKEFCNRVFPFEEDARDAYNEYIKKAAELYAGKIIVVQDDGCISGVKIHKTLPKNYGYGIVKREYIGRRRVLEKETNKVKQFLIKMKKRDSTTRKMIIKKKDSSTKEIG